MCPLPADLGETVPLRLLACLCAALALTACTKGGTDGQTHGDGDASPRVAAPPPETGVCRVLRPSDIAQKADDSAPVTCSRSHTAETYLVDAFRGKLAKAGYDDPKLAAHAYQVCSKGFKKFTGADDSLALRSVLAWAWFRPSEPDWAAGARWYRCDVVGGTDQSAQLVTLPRTAKGVLLGIPGRPVDGLRGRTLGHGRAVRALHPAAHLACRDDDRGGPVRGPVPG